MAQGLASAEDVRAADYGGMLQEYVEQDGENLVQGFLDDINDQVNDQMGQTLRQTTESAEAPLESFLE
jgi:hypothetical protein